jgi:hypothetical protein
MRFKLNGQPEVKLDFTFLRQRSNDNAYDGISGNTAGAISYPSTFFASTIPYQNHHYNEHHEEMLEIAKRFLHLFS